MPAPRVVLTRQPPQAGALEEGLREAGCTVQFLPLTDFELPADAAQLRRAVQRLSAGEYTWLLLTSPNAVRALAQAGWEGSLPEQTRVAVTGPGTARLLPEVGCIAEPWMPDGDHSAAGVVAGFPAGPGRPLDCLSGTETPTAQTIAADAVLLPQSSLATEQVAAGLTDRGWSVDRVEAYRTVPYPADPQRRLLAGPAPGHHAGDAVVGDQDVAGAAVVLTSPSAARELGRRPVLTDPRVLAATRFVAIGEPSRRAAEQVGIPLNRTAATPDAAGILDALGVAVEMDDAGIPQEEFAEPGELRDRLVAAILDGHKTATAALLAEYEAEGLAVPRRGDRGRVPDSAGQVVAVIETTSVDVVPLGRVPDRHVAAEGEGHESVEDWRRAHERFWDDSFTGEGGGPPQLDDDTPVVLQSFVRIR